MTLAGFEPRTSCMETQCSNDCTTKSLYKWNEKFVVFEPDWVLPYITCYALYHPIFWKSILWAFRIYGSCQWYSKIRKFRFQAGVLALFWKDFKTILFKFRGRVESWGWKYSLSCSCSFCFDISTKKAIFKSRTD